MSSFQHKIESYGLYFILLLTIVLRVLYWLQARQSFWFAFPGMDPEFYNTWANAILSGRASNYIPFPRAPLYPYLLAGLKSVFGNGWLIPRLFNLAADMLTVFFVYKITNRIRGKITALIAALLFSICGISIYFSGELLMTSVATACAAGFVLMFANNIKKPTCLNSALSGVMLALLALFRPNALVILPVSFVVILLVSFFRHVRTHKYENNLMKPPFYSPLLCRGDGEKSYFQGNDSQNRHTGTCDGTPGFS
ncbi:glycosyltransferase family 39 protein, partial [bacterium]|nr:glycosyltransferase family 39 protein [bacterium]